MKQEHRLAVERSEEELVPHVTTHEAGKLGVRKTIEHEHYEQLVPREVEDADIERVAAHEADSGQVETLPDGSISVPVFEERIVVEKRLVVRERIIVRKYTVTEEHVVEADLRRERAEVVADPTVADRVHDQGG